MTRQTPLPASEFSFEGDAATFTASIPAVLAEELVQFMSTRNVGISDVVRIALRTINRHPLAYDVDTLVNFGKYNGEQLGTVIRVDPEYVEWARRNIEAFRLTTAAKILLDGFRLGLTATTAPQAAPTAKLDFSLDPLSAGAKTHHGLKGHKQSPESVAKRIATRARNKALKERAAARQAASKRRKGDTQSATPPA